jgi:peptidoglycan/LPS O-acetylase OafA/YrhL
MLWVILGHEYSTIFIIAENLPTIDDRISTYYFLMVNAGLFAVDTFFFLGGFFVAWSVLREKIQSVGKCGLAILNRWMRLVPAYLMAILIYYSMFVHFGSGPYWEFSTAAVKNCDSIWRPILFVDNLVENGKNQCMDWGWYLQNDMQIFIYSMFLLMIYQKNKFAGYMALVWSVLLSFYWTFLAIYNGNYKNLTHSTDLAFQANYQEDIYIKPWSRCPPYLLGLALGMLYSEFLQAEKKGEDHLLVRWKKRMEDDRRWKWAIEALGFFLGLWLVLIPRTAQGPHYWPQLAHSLYLTYGKTLFVLSVALIILPSVLGVPSFIRTILDTKLFSFVGKASYCTYLIHLIIIMGWVGAFSTNFYFESIVQYQLFCSHTVICVFLGFLLSLLVEIPFSKLQKMLINKMQNKDKN